MDTLQSLNRKLEGANDLKSVVRTMKAVSASNIGQYETAIKSLTDYYNTILLGLAAFFGSENNVIIENKLSTYKNKNICAIVFGSDQGLVGRFNDSLANFASKSLLNKPGKKVIWSIGERMQLLLLDEGFKTSKHFSVPNAVKAITPLIGHILTNIEVFDNNEELNDFYIFYNQTKASGGYTQIEKRLLPLDEKWKQSLDDISWNTKQIPQIIGESKITLQTFISEYLFVTLFRASVESLASENASRLTAMQRAENNIEELLDKLGHQFHRLRQSSIDEELFDVVSGFEALNRDSAK